MMHSEAIKRVYGDSEISFIILAKGEKREDVSLNILYKIKFLNYFQLSISFYTSITLKIFT